MIRRAFIFLKAIRVVESTLMTGFPLIGLIFAMQPGAISHPIDFLTTVALFCFSTFFLVIYVYAFNSWGGMEADKLNQRLDDHPVLTGDITERQLRIIAYAGIAVNLILFRAFFPRCLFLAPFIAVNWTIYSHPKVMAKARPVWGTTVHFIGGVLQVLLGYVVLLPFEPRGVLASVYFALVFAAGHLNHEVKDHDADKNAGLRTNAVVFGPRRMLSVAFVVFTVAFFYLLGIVIAGYVSWLEAWSFLAIYPVHLLLHRRMIKGLGDEVYDISYQRAYRALFVAAGAVLLITKLATSF
jgi:4-hydroxybenzoate polyprenyltransferase